MMSLMLLCGADISPSKGLAGADGDNATFEDLKSICNPICNLGNVPVDKSSGHRIKSILRCGSNSVVECNLAKVEVAGSNPVSRFRISGLTIQQSSRCGEGDCQNSRPDVS